MQMAEIREKETQAIFLVISHSGTNYDTGGQCVARGKCLGRAGECQSALGRCRLLAG